MRDVRLIKREVQGLECKTVESEEGEVSVLPLPLALTTGEREVSADRASRLRAMEAKQHWQPLRRETDADFLRLPR